MSKSVLVTGAAGFIASHLVEALLNQGYHVVGIDNLRTGSMENLKHALVNENFEFIEKDICEETFSTSLNLDLEYVFHLAAISSVKLSTENPYLVNQVNVTGTINVLNLARKSGTRRIIFTSSAAVYGDPEEIPTQETNPLCALSPYAASKIAGEHYVSAFSNSYDMESTTLRLFNIYGPRQAYSEYSGVISIFINRLLNGEVLQIEGEGNHTRSFVYVRDLVDALMSAATHEKAANKIFNISGESPTSVNEIVEKLRKVTSRDVKVEHIAPRIGDIEHSLGSTRLASDLLDFTPRVSFEDGLRETYEWYEKNH